MRPAAVGHARRAIAAAPVLDQMPYVPAEDVKSGAYRAANRPTHAT